MLEAGKITHIPAKVLAMHLILVAICLFSSFAFGSPYILPAGNSSNSETFQKNLKHLNITVLGNYTSAFDRLLTSTEGAPSADPVPVSFPNMVALVGSAFVVPVTVGDTTGKEIRSIQFDVLYDENVIVPQASPIDTAGTIADGMGVSFNDTVPGVLRVVFFASTNRTGAGTLFKLKFTAVGTNGQASPLTWRDFMFNEGDPAAAVTDGSVELVINHTITVTQSPNGTIAPGTTVVPYGDDQIFTITPAPNHHIVDVIVDGVSQGPYPTYTFTDVKADHAITATFAIDTFPIIASSGPNGTVTPAGTTNIAFGGSQTYTITPSANYLIDDVLVDGVSIGAVSSHTFENVTQGHTIAATFKIKRFALTVLKPGNGIGSVTSSPAGIDCGSDCEETYDIGTPVTLTATPTAGTTFTGWTGGGCSGTGTCVIAMDAAKEITATFVLQTYSLNILKVGNGSGTVTSTPIGIDCGADCEQTYNHGTIVTLAATPAAGTNFTGWSGACTGTGTCVVTVTAAATVTANFVLQQFSFNVIKAGSGTGTVTSAPAGIDCGTDCAESYNYGTSVTLTAVPDISSTFTGWSGACSGTGTCVVPMNAAATVTATFTIKTFSLSVTKAGNGQGSVTSSPTGIDCGSDCQETYTHGTAVTLTATPDANSIFAGWSGGACSGTGSCVVTITAAATVTATFTLKTFTLNVAKAGNGAGTVTSTPTGIDCGTDCAESYNIGTVVTLTAVPATGSNFTGWSGAGCSGTGTCVVTMNAAAAVTATFTLQTFALNVVKAGNGAGTVTSAPGIDCGPDCAETYNFGTVVTLTALAATGSDFTGWSGGGCSGTGTCVVTVSSAATVTATFTLKQFSLQVNRVGTGTGTVTSSPPGIDCGSDCFDLYDHNTVVTLTAVPNINSTFTGWNGTSGCSGTGTCVVTMTQARTVNAVFVMKTFKLDVFKAGNGSGTVTSAPAGIDCGADCSETYNYGVTVTLTAAPNASSNFTGWSGGVCTGTGTCVVTMTQASTVTATFVLKTFSLNVTKAGTGFGTVTSTPPGIDCGADCSEIYNIGTVVMLTAEATAGSTFDGWSGGGCSGTGTCTVTIAAATTVTPTFTRIVRTLTITKSGNGSGTVISTPAGLNCVGTATCSAPFPIGSQVTLTASTSVGADFIGWTGAGCSGMGTCVVTMNADTTVNAEFVLQRFKLSIIKSGTGVNNGTVVSTPAGISCGADCDEMYNFNSAIALNATTTPGTTFNGWDGGGCVGTGTCVVSMSQATDVTATFTIQTFALSVTKNGNGFGTITSDPTGINCGADCAEVYNIGTVVTLTATPNAGSNFTGWSGACTGTGTCAVSMSQARMVNANFTLQSHPLDIVRDGNGTGTVTSAPTGINCGADCSESYNYETIVTLSASPNANSDFTGWSGGGCSGTGTCVVTITAATSVKATFTLKTFTLDVDKISNGTGTISSSPVGIDCGGDCTQLYNIGTEVTLTATPGSGSSFAGWSGACSGTGTCVVTMNAASSVTAAFNTFPTVQFSTGSFTGNESRNATVKITRSGDLTIASSVTLSTSPGTAIGAPECAAGVDFIDVSQTVNFAPQETERTLAVGLCPDVEIDASETIDILLSSPVNANTGGQNTAVVKVNDTANQFYAGTGGILLFSSTNSEPYPSMINVENAPSGQARIRVTLYDVWHANPANLYAMLVSPQGQKYVFMGAVGGSSPVNPNSPVTLTFGDPYYLPLPTAGPLVTGAFTATTCQTPISDFPFPAPAGPYLEPGCQASNGPSLSGAFYGETLNGGWELYLKDAGTGIPFTQAGAVLGGWGLELVPSDIPPVQVSGQVLTPGLLGLRNAVVSLTDSQGNRRSTSSSSLGFFSFDNVEAGGPYLLTVSSRRYRFESKTLHFFDNVQNLEFVGLE